MLHKTFYTNENSRSLEILNRPPLFVVVAGVVFNASTELMKFGDGRGRMRRLWSVVTERVGNAPWTESQSTFTVKTRLKRMPENTNVKWTW